MASEGLYQRIYDVIARVPAGKVVTYGQVALALGMPHGARVVGWAMRSCPEGVPWHRVVNSRGETGVRDPAGSQLQRSLLEDEGVVFGLDGKIDLKMYGWDEI